MLDEKIGKGVKGEKKNKGEVEGEKRKKNVPLCS